MNWIKAPTTDRRFKCVSVDVVMLSHLFTPGRESAVVCVEGVPDDAALVNVYVDQQMMPPTVCYVFEHPSWEPVEEGAYPPMFFPVWRAGDLHVELTKTVRR